MLMVWPTEETVLKGHHPGSDDTARQGQSELTPWEFQVEATMLICFALLYFYLTMVGVEGSDRKLTTNSSRKEKHCTDRTVHRHKHQVLFDQVSATANSPSINHHRIPSAMTVSA